MSETMRAAVFEGHEQIVLEERPIPACGPTDAIVKVTLTTICGTDVHIWRERIPGRARPASSAMSPSGSIHRARRRGVDRLRRSAIACWSARSLRAASASPASRTTSRSAGPRATSWETIGGWRLGNTIDGAQAEYFRVPDAQAQPGEDSGRPERRAVRAPRRHRVHGHPGAESATCGRAAVVGVRPGPDRPLRDSGREADGRRAGDRRGRRRRAPAMARQMGADVVLDSAGGSDVAARCSRLTGGGGDVAIEALGTAGDVRDRLRVAPPGGTLSSLGVYSGKLALPYDAFGAGLGDKQDRHHALPGRQGAHAPADGAGAARPARPHAAASRTASPLDRHRRGVRAVRQPARRRAEDRTASEGTAERVGGGGEGRRSGLTPRREAIAAAKTSPILQQGLGDDVWQS